MPIGYFESHAIASSSVNKNSGSDSFFISSRTWLDLFSKISNKRLTLENLNVTLYCWFSNIDYYSINPL